MAEIGGCSEGFACMDPMLAPMERKRTVGESVWRAFPTPRSLEAISKALREEPNISHCSDLNCIRCDDSIAWGPVTPREP